MYSFVTVWTSMDDGPYWVILLMYEFHDMRHTSFRRLTMVNGTPGFWGVTGSVPVFIVGSCRIYGLDFLNSIRP